MAEKQSGDGDHTEHEVEVEGGVILARDYGGVGPDVVLIHGAGHNAAGFDAFAPLLTGAFRLVSYDVRGHGRSPVDPQLGLDSWVTDLEAVVATLELDTTCVVGHSLGASIGLAYCTRHPPRRGLVNLDGPVLPLPELYRVAGLELNLAEIEARHRQNCFVGSLDDFDAHLAARAYPPFIPMFRRGVIPAGDGQWMSRPTVEEWMAIQHALWTFDPAPLFDGSNFPLLMVLVTNLHTGGNVEASLDAKRRTVAALGASRLDIETVWLDTTHFMISDRPRQVAALVREFITRP